jgi:hypothetical protein
VTASPTEWLSQPLLSSDNVRSPSPGNECEASSARAAMAAYGLFRIEPVELRPCVLSQDEARKRGRPADDGTLQITRSFEPGMHQRMAVHNTSPGGAPNCR